MTEVEQPPQNGIDLSANEEDENSKARPADIEQDMREMERRKRVEAIMGSKLFREELERIVDSARDSGNTAGILQQLSDIVGVPASRVGSVYKASNCMMPINDIRGVESMGYAKGEKILRCKLAATFRLLDLYGWTQGLGAQITARLKVDQEYFLVNPYGLLYHEITASSLNKVDMQGHIVEQGTTNFGVNRSHFILHSAVHAARPDIRCAIYIGCSPVVAISSLKTGLLPLTKDACVLGEVTTFSYTGCLLDEEERDKLVRNLGPNSKVMLLTNHGALCCGETIEEAFFAACHIVQACETQLKLLPVGLDNLVLIPEESRKIIYEQSRCPPEDLAKKFAAAVAVADSNKATEEEDKTEGGETTTTTTNTKVLGQTPKWRVGGAEFEALMRMLDNAGYRTGYIYRHPLIKSDPPKPKNDVELPPAVSSLGYLLEEEELFRQGIWKKGVMGKGGDRSRWLNSPNVYQKVEVLETGTPDPKKITKWVAEGSPTHSTPVRIDDPLQFVPVNTNPKEFKRLQQQIKDNRRADKISAGPQSHILEGVTWDEANRIKDATVSQAGDHVVLMGAASKGIIQRGFQHNATVYKAPYAKNPFDNVTDDELNEYKRTVERKKKSIHGEYTDTDFSESEALSSLQTSGAQQQTKQNTTTTTTTAAVSQSEPEDISEHQVMRIETQQAPVPSQPEVVLSDATLSFINGERSHTATNRKPPTGRDGILSNTEITQDLNSNQETIDIIASQCPDNTKTQRKENTDTIDHETNYCIATNLCNTYSSKQTLIDEMKSDGLFQRQNQKVLQTPPPLNHSLTSSLHASPAYHTGNDNTLDMSFHSRPISSNSKSKQTNDLNSLKAPFISPNRSKDDTLSYYTTSYYNSQRLTGETSPIYDYATNSSTHSVNNTGAPVRLYAISSNCCTPQICEHILETLHKTPSSQHQQNYAGAKSSLDLIWNIPFRQNDDNSPCITPDVLSTPPARKFRAAESNSSRKSRSPYRTLSHFGFNSPQREPQPDHKHILPMDCKRYVPLRRSVSYEEIFASPRYVDLCEHCFEQIVRLKPELMQYRIQLSNLAEYERPPLKSPTAGNSNVLDGTAERDSPLKDDDCAPIDLYSAFTSQLEPLIEVEEKDSSDLPNGGGLSSTFIDKITRMNYSEISNNFINTPGSVTISQLSLEDVEENVYGNRNRKDNVVNENLCKELENLKIFVAGEMEANEIEAIKCNDNNDAESEEHFVSITDIFEFNNWLDEAAASQEMQDRSEEPNDEVFNNLSDFMDCEKAAGITSDKTQSNVKAGFTKATCFESPPPPTPAKNFQRSLMNRDERSRRKLEFYDLWEDHVRYCENREQVMASASYSDTESAIDETQHTQQPNKMDDQANEEIFPSQSFLFSHKPYVSQTPKNQRSQENLDDEELKSSSSSKQTFNISETNSSRYGSTTTLEDYKDDGQKTRQTQEEERSDLTQQEADSQSFSRTRREHLLFHALGSTNITDDVTLAPRDGYSNRGIRKFIDDDSDEVDDALPGAQSSLDDNKAVVVFHEKNKQNYKNDRIERIEILEDQLLTNIEKCTTTKEQRQTGEELLKTREKIRAVIGEAESRKQNEIETNNQEKQNKDDDQQRPLVRYKSGILDICEGEHNAISRKANDADLEMTLEFEAYERAINQELHSRGGNHFEELFKGIETKKLHQNEHRATMASEDEDDLKYKNPTSLDHFPKQLNLDDREIFGEANTADIFYLGGSLNNPENKENEVADEQLNSLEKTILHKIEYHQLNKTEEIFNKIENTIRNKLTPSKLEMLVKGQVLDDSNALVERMSTPQTQRHECSSEILSESLNRRRSTRRSRSLTPFNKNPSSPTFPSKCNRTTTPPMGPRKQQHFSPQRTPSPCSSSHSKQRNFILENIRNAAIPRSKSQVKRLQGNTQAIFCKNPFGPRLSTSTGTVNAISKPANISMKSHFVTNLDKTPPYSPPDCGTEVYAFESKLVRGSPRFWVSMSASPVKKPLTANSSSNKSNRKKPRSTYSTETNSLELDPLKVSSGSSIVDAKETEPSPSDAVARVDAEINALGEEIQKIQPRLETYKRKLDDFGNRVAKCARNMDECVATHEEIITEHDEYKESRVLQLYVDNVICRVQTFSLSETED